MKRSFSPIFLSAALLMIYSESGFADDIDIYSGNGSAGTPNIMIVIDNAANSDADMGACTYWDGSIPSGGPKTLGNDQCALANLAHTLSINIDGSAALFLGITDMSGVKVPLLPIDDKTFTASILGGVTIPAGSTNRQAFILAVKGLSENPGKAAQGAEMQETWAYYTGGNGGTTGTGILSNKSYSGTNAKSGCQRNYIVFLSGVKSSASHALDANEYPPLTASINNAVSAGIMTSALGAKLNTPISGKPEAGYGIEWARFMYNYDSNPTSTGLQNIISYSIGTGATAVPPAAVTNSMEQYIVAIANYGGGKYYPVGPSGSALQGSLLQIFNEVQSVNSVFASASLPVSVSAQGSYQNQVFLGMFRPDPNGNPRWLGNLKQYQFIYDPITQNLQLGDSKSPVPDLALSSSSSGFISPNVTSFWTSRSSGTSADANGFYVNDPTGVGQAFDLPDGDLVEKGGAAQRLRIDNLTTAPISRNLYTYCPTLSGACVPDLTSSANAFSTANASLASFTSTQLPSAMSPTLINWVRGQDNAGDEKGPGSPVTVRPSIHGDVLHSRPVVINYGGTPATEVVFYGSNDGVFHAVNGNATGTGAGSELWGFIPTELFPALKRQRDNAPQLLLPSTPSGITPTPLPKDYFVDGSTGVYQSMKSDGITVDKAYLFITMRRGGRFIYALDVSTPNKPKFLWKKSYSDTGFSELGQTWSRPKVAAVAGYANPVLIFGGGYDPAEDVDSSTRPTDSIGRGIFILDAITGSLVWSATNGNGNGTTKCTGVAPTTCKVPGMNYSIPADISLLDRNRDGKIDRLYAADIAGNVWRIDLEPTGGNTPDKWQINQLTALGTGSNRKFFFPPDVVPTGAAGSIGSYDAVLVGSGDREHPLYTSTSLSTVNRFYMVKDTKTGNDGSGQTTVVESALFDATATPYDSTLSGYYVTLGTGEKVVNAPTTIGGVTYFGTNQPTVPSQSSCTSNLGIAKGYQLATFAGTTTYTRFDGGGLPPSPVGGLVNILLTDGTYKLVPFLIGGGGAGVGSVPSALSPGNPMLTAKRKRFRTYWYNERD